MHGQKTTVHTPNIWRGNEKIEHYMENYTDYSSSTPKQVTKLNKEFLVAQHYMEQLIMTDKNSIILNILLV